jgi:hypothetical protein
LIVPAGPEPAPPAIHNAPTVTFTSPPADREADLPVIVVGDEAEPPQQQRPALQQPFDPSWVSFPRRLLYIHALVFGLVMAGVFTLGYFVGRDPWRRLGGGPSSGSTGPIAVDGRVTYANRADEQVGDDGAVIIALPRARQPSRTEKPSLSGLGPLDPSPPDNDPVLEAIATLGGAYVRADQEGRFRLALPQSGDYYLLYISRNASRGQSTEISRQDRAAMGEYFTSATELIGRQRHAWLLKTLDADSDASHSFVERPS